MNAPMLSGAAAERYMEAVELRMDEGCGRAADPEPDNPHFPRTYKMLFDVLKRAHDQAAFGKGKERHASDGVPFDEQPMTTINDLLGSGDGFIYQAIKKAIESKRLPPDRAVAELLGAINYLAGRVLQIERSRVER